MTGRHQCRTCHLPSAGHDPERAQQRHGAREHFERLLPISHQHRLRCYLQCLDAAAQIACDGCELALLFGIELTECGIDLGYPGSEGRTTIADQLTLNE